jgi:Flp pilus assembly pilin Flp
VCAWSRGLIGAVIARISARNADQTLVARPVKRGLTAMRTTKRAHTPSEPTPETNATALIRATRGSVMVEYLALTGVVALVIAAAAVMLGAPLIHLFHYEQTLLLLPVP